MSSPGTFISFEGGDGVGKSTQLRLLALWLADGGHEVVATREPGGTPLGVALREAVMHGDHVAPRAEALIYAADRAHHVATVVRPALERGAVVLTDRYLDSSVAYQGTGRDLGADEVERLSLWAVEGLLPDLTVLLDLDPAVGMSRLTGDPDRLNEPAPSSTPAPGRPSWTGPPHSPVGGWSSTRRSRSTPSGTWSGPGWRSCSRRCR